MNLHKQMTELLKAVAEDIYKLEEYIDEHETDFDFLIQNNVSIKKAQLAEMEKLRDSLSSALWERFDDNGDF